MNPTTRHAIADRDRALGRLRTVTLGSAMAGIVGVAGFGAAAAATFSGKPASAPATVVGSDQTDPSTTSTSTQGLQRPALAPRSTRSRGQVTTGSS